MRADCRKYLAFKSYAYFVTILDDNLKKVVKNQLTLFRYFQLKFRYVKLLFYYLWDLRTWDLLKISTTTKKGSYVKCWVSLENIENNQFSVTSDGVGEQNKKVN